MSSVERRQRRLRVHLLGALGHRNEVLSVDVKPTPLFSDLEINDDDEARDARDFVFVSGAMDKMVKVWSTRGYSHLLELSERWPEQQKKGTAAARVGAATRDGFSLKKKTTVHSATAGINKTRRAFGGAAEAEALAAALTDGTLDPSVTPFPTKHVQTPVFSSFKVHGNYVDWAALVRRLDLEQERGAEDASLGV